ncbi:hypothetical protein KIL84_014220 [Mauremys mutica]|uniref:Uncharacterized protein n=1 Tax=Mauremys mutica TaxID=74926 RepID=A0A9D3XN15_9SAUR|nr:hypothetical protein KIL84_014220 [Mauremys mutica]
MSPHKGTGRLQRAGADLFGNSSDFHQLTLSGAAYRKLMSPGNMPERPREETVLQPAETQGSLKHRGDSMLGSSQSDRHQQGEPDQICDMELVGGKCGLRWTKDISGASEEYPLG